MSVPTHRRAFLFAPAFLIMPDLKDRRKREAELAAAILLLFGNQERAIAAAWPREPDWVGMERDMTNALRSRLSHTFSASAEQMAGQYRMRLSAPEIRRWGQQWADGYSASLSREITMTTRESVLRGAGLTKPPPIPFATRAENISVTETTRSITAGERWAVDRYDMETGQELIPIWNTEQDALTCEICEPLHGTGEEVFGGVAPGGPPVHPRCRCWLEYETVGAELATA
jgi:hypothetical protein